MRSIFITGITGLLGTNLANELLDLGYSVTAIVRNPEKYYGKLSANLQLIQMGLFDDYDAYLQGIDIVVHIAAETATNKIDYTSYKEVNDLATTRLFKKAQENNVAKFIFISTANTIGFGSIEKPGKEGDEMRAPFSKHFYAQSKFNAEQNLLSLAKETELKILNPTFMIGANDSKPSSGQLLLMGLNKRVVFYPPGGKSFVPVKDVVQAIINSFDKGVVGEKYLISGDNLSYKEFFQKLNRINNQSAMLIPIPRFLLILVGMLGNVMRLFKIKTSLSVDNLKALCIYNYYSNQKSIEDLGVSYTSIDEAIEESATYFKGAFVKR